MFVTTESLAHAAGTVLVILLALMVYYAIKAIRNASLETKPGLIPPSVELALALLESDNSHDRVAGIHALQMFGNNLLTRHAATALMARANDPDEHEAVRKAATELLHRLSGRRVA